MEKVVSSRYSKVRMLWRDQWTFVLKIISIQKLQTFWRCKFIKFLRQGNCDKCCKWGQKEAKIYLSLWITAMMLVVLTSLHKPTTYSLNQRVKSLWSKTVEYQVLISQLYCHEWELKRLWRGIKVEKVQLKTLRILLLKALLDTGLSRMCSIAFFKGLKLLKDTRKSSSNSRWLDLKSHLINKTLEALTWSNIKELESFNKWDLRDSLWTYLLNQQDL